MRECRCAPQGRTVAQIVPRDRYVGRECASALQFCSFDPPGNRMFKFVAPSQPVQTSHYSMSVALNFYTLCYAIVLPRSTIA
jgi:hypothetical protein